jgi:hypothetical protein
MGMSDQPTEDDSDRVLADCVEEFHRRRALGERPRAEDYASLVGDRFVELCRVLETEGDLDAVLDDEAAQSAFPRPFGERSRGRSASTRSCASSAAGRWAWCTRRCTGRWGARARSRC